MQVALNAARYVSAIGLHLYPDAVDLGDGGEAVFFRSFSANMAKAISNPYSIPYLDFTCASDQDD